MGNSSASDDWQLKAERNSIRFFSCTVLQNAQVGAYVMIWMRRKREKMDDIQITGNGELFL